MIALNKENSREYKVLMIASQEIENNPNDGGKRVSNRNWNLLMDTFGTDNVFLWMFDKGYKKASYEKSDNDKVQSHVYRIKPFNNYLDRALCVLKGDFFENHKCDLQVIRFINSNGIDIVFIDRTLFGRLSMMIRKRTKAKIWAFSHNIEKEYMWKKFSGNYFFSCFFSYIAMISEKHTISTAERLFVLTKRDMELHHKYYGITPDYVLPVSFVDCFDAQKVKCGSKTNELLFVGSMFPPNYDGIKWFIDEVMPKIPSWHLTIVGKNFEQKRAELSRKNVEVVGTVGNLEKYYYESNVMVMPIFYGAGQKVKTAEAMMYGKIIIGTDEALEGYDVAGTKGIYRCNNSSEFITALRDVAKHHADGWSEDVRALFVEKYSYHAAIKTMKIIVDEYYS